MFVKHFMSGQRVSHFRPLAAPLYAAGFSPPWQTLQQSFHSGSCRPQISRLSSQQQTYLTTDRSSLASKLLFQESAWIRMYATWRNRFTGNRIFIREMEVMKEKLKDGDVPKLRNITSLPEVPSIHENQSFVSLCVENDDKFSDGLMMLAASSETENFVRYVNPHKQIHEVLGKFVGVEYNSETDQLMRDGKPLETVEEEAALRDFIDFLKRQKDPVLVTFKGDINPMVRLYKVTKRYPSLYSDIMSLAPVHIEAYHMSQKLVPESTVRSYTLGALCQGLLDLDQPLNDPVSRANGIHLLFTQHFLTKGAVDQFCESSDYHYCKDTYIKLIVNNTLQLAVASKLAAVGLGLDHLMYLKLKGYDIFEKYLSERKIWPSDIEYLYQIL